jgi:ABC-type uncharacterized transport system auxiliary subunit
MKKISFLSIILILTFACLSSPPKKYHQIYLPENPRASSIKINKIIFVDRIQTMLFYDNFEIVYRESPYQLNYYSYDFWAEKPAILIRDSIIDYFKKNKIFSGVLKELTGKKADYTLKARIRAIEEDDRADAWHARLSMEIDIVDFLTGKLILSYEFDKMKTLPQMDVKELPVALSQILEEELITLIQSLSQIVQ